MRIEKNRSSNCWYDPVTGRWLSKDPIGISGGLNMYEAFANNPVNFRDPFGDEPITITVGGVTVGAGTALGYAASGALLYWSITPEGQRSVQGLIQATGDGLITGIDTVRNAIEELVNSAKGKGQRKGERGQTGSPDGTDNPWKHRRPDPSNPNKMFEKDTHTGKWKQKPRPPNAPWALGPFVFDRYLDQNSDMGGRYADDKCQ